MSREVIPFWGGFGLLQSTANKLTRQNIPTLSHPTLPQHTLSHFFCLSTHYGRPPHSVSMNQVTLHIGDTRTYRNTHTLCVVMHAMV